MILIFMTYTLIGDLVYKSEKDPVWYLERLLESANQAYAAYLDGYEQNISLSELCDNIRDGYKRRVVIGIDYSADVGFDYDWNDMETTPIGLTDEDYKRLNRCKAIPVTLDGNCED